MDRRRRGAPPAESGRSLSSASPADAEHGDPDRHADDGSTDAPPDGAGHGPSRAASGEVGRFLAERPEGDAGDLIRLLGRRYPPVVYGIEDPEYLPVFVFHSVVEADLEAKLAYLQANGYRTVSLDEAVAWMRGDARLPPKPVALTIDDGRRSTWSVAAPLLERFGMRATAYVVPGYLDDGPARPTLTDVWSGTVPRDDVELDEGEDAAGFMRWSEVEALHRGEAVDVQSHTMLHRRVWAGPRSSGFVPPGWTGPLFNLPQAPGDRRRWTRAGIDGAAGTPMFACRPLLSLRRGWAGGAAFRRACLERVRAEGAEDFFARRDWRRVLRKLRHRARGSEPEWVELTREKEWELAESRRSLEERLPEGRFQHFCYPNSSGGPATVGLARDAGYVSGAWGLLDHRVTNRPGADPHLLSRIKHDFIFCLPGDGRRSLFEVLKAKVVRRSRGEKGY